MAKKPKNYLLHILGSLLFISIPVFSSPDFDSSFMLFGVPPFQKNFITYLLLLAFFYGNYLYLIPKFYFGNKKAVYLIAVIAAFCTIAFLPSLLISDSHETMRPMQDINGHGPGPGGFDFAEGGPMFQFLLVFFLSFLLRVNNRLSAIQSEKLKTEVSYLKAQINPHFLFNTLNSLYSLTLSKSDNAPTAVLKLSGMMRYVVTESTRDYVALDKELEYIKNYIDLQQYRMDDTTRLSFSIKGSPAGKNISPLVLIPFIENAFKHGLNPDGDSAILIKIDIVDDKLILKVKNSKFNYEVPEEMKSEQGIENTELRLKYLYPEKHKLLIFDTPEAFEVKLEIQL